jgi:hypothetical protein
MATRPENQRPSVLVVYESMFGNTGLIANAIADGLAVGANVQAAEVNAAPTSVRDISLLVVGGPTHAFSMSRPSTRADARKQQGSDTSAASEIGIREWLDRLEVESSTRFVAFDTRVRRPRLPGSAARAASRQLRARGLSPLALPVTYWVNGTPGPLVEGEIERARHWGEQLAAHLADALVRH